MGTDATSKGTGAAMHVLVVSGNYCTDKKPVAINWVKRCGYSVIAGAAVMESVLKTSVGDLCVLNVKRNLVGSATAGSIGGRGRG